MDRVWDFLLSVHGISGPQGEWPTHFSATPSARKARGKTVWDRWGPRGCFTGEIRGLPHRPVIRHRVLVGKILVNLPCRGTSLIRNRHPL